MDSSFSSHPDDFGSAPDINNLIESSELSESLLFCLDGNRPVDMSINDNQLTDFAATSRISYVPSHPTVEHASRKRTANGGEDGREAVETQQYFDELHPKKIAVVLGVPGETSL